MGAIAPHRSPTVGPAPCAIERIKKRWRWHLLLKSEHPAALTRVARYFLERFEEVVLAPRGRGAGDGDVRR